MSHKKSNKIISIFQIFFYSAKTYFLYLDQITKRLLFPVFGQLISLYMLGFIAYFFNRNYDNLRKSYPFFENDTNYYLIILITILPFLIIFIKAMYEYIISLTSMNILFFTVSKKKSIQKVDFNANDNVIQRKLFQYIIILFLLSILLIVPPFIFLAPVIGIFLSLTLQIFAFEGENVNSISRSISLVKDNFIPTILMLLLCGLSTYIFIPSLFIWCSEKTSFISLLINNCEKFVSLLPLDDYNTILSIINIEIDSLSIAKIIAESLISFPFISFTMPFRCCCFTELYKLYDSNKIKDYSKQSDEIIKRAAGKKRKN